MSEVPWGDVERFRLDKAIQDLDDHEFCRRNDAAAERLNKAGLLEQAGRWIEKNPPPCYWRGTAFEWAELEMLT